MIGTVLQRVLGDEAIEVCRHCSGDFRGATGAGAIDQALHPLGGEAMDPLAQRRIGKVQRVRDGLEAVPGDDLADGLGAPEHAGLLGLLEAGLQGGKGLIGKVEFESPHRGGLQDKRRQLCTGVYGLWGLLWQHNLFDSNFHGAAYALAILRGNSLRVGSDIQVMLAGNGGFATH
jgi:hypothetical protein